MVYLATKPSRPVEEEIAERGVIEAINTWQMMGGAFAGYTDLMDAPAWFVARMRLVQAGKSRAEQKQAEEAEAEAKKGASGSGGSGGGVSGNGGRNTRVSAYYPE